MNTMTLKQQAREELYKELHLRFTPKNSGASNDFLDFIDSLITQVVQEEREKCIQEFINHERCYDCGEKKELGLSDSCINCLEEN